MDSVEMLVPHFMATMKLDWRFPHLSDVLEAASSVGFEETHAQESYLTQFDGPAHGDDEKRRARFLNALTHARTLADRSESLTFDRLVEVQERLLGYPVTFRSGDAYSHGGQRRYLHSPDLAEIFACKIRKDEDSCHPIARAIRLYLDLAFFHPFADGNARAARLGLEFVLRRARVPTPPLHPLVLLPKTPGDVACYERCVRIVASGIIGRSWREERS